MSHMVTRELVFERLAIVIDPELHVDIVGLGLIYAVAIDERVITVTMTLTTPGCPLAPIIDKLVREALMPLGDYTVELVLVWEPAWNREMMSEEVRLQLGMI